MDKILKLIKLEKKRQEINLNLIASESYANINILQAQGSILTNKYAEGYYKKRYYGGCKYIDKIEKIAINRAKKIFKADYVNVQPHSGSQANLAVYNAILKPGDTILSMKLNHGGHLTHGSKKNISGKIYNIKYYSLNKKELIDFNKIEYLAKKYKPKLIIAGFSSYSRICNWKKFKYISNLYNSYLLIDIAHIAGLIAAKIYPNPLKYADIVTSTTHKTLSGPRGGIILARGHNNELYNKINSSVFPGIQGGPLMHVIAAKAIAFKNALTKKFISYQKKIIKNSKYMCKIFMKNNFKIISNGTDTHLFVINLEKKNITGIQAEKKLNLANIIVNKNCIPDDNKKPFITSGIRIGTTCITYRKIKKDKIKKITKFICKILNNINNYKIIKKTRKKVIKICKKFPIYKFN